MRKLITLTVLLSAYFVTQAGVGFAGVYGGVYGIDEKLGLEEALAKRVQKIAVNMLGSENIIVFVDVEQNLTLTQEGPSLQTPSYKSGDAAQNYLPGIPMDAVQTELSARPDGSFRQTVKLPDFVKSISTTLILDEKITDDKIKGLSTYLNDFMMINSGRGDTLHFKKMAFTVNRQEELLQLKNALIPQLPLILGIIVFALFIFGPVRMFMKNIVSAVEVFKIQADTRILTKIENSTPRQIDASKPAGYINTGDAINQLPMSSQSGQLGEERHFSFINTSNFKNLIYLLKTEKPEAIAIVLTYIPSHFSNEIMESLPMNLRVETLKLMAKVRQYSKDDVRVVEDMLKEKVNYLLGGPQNIAELINICEPEIREKMLEEISDPELKREIMKMLITAEDIAKLSKEHLYELYKLLGTRVFAAALTGMSEDIKTYVFDNLSEGARDMLAQEIDMVAGKIPQARTNQAKKDLIVAMKNFEMQGIIKIPRGGDVQTKSVI